jgi:hypothetical protein
MVARASARGKGQGAFCATVNREVEMLDDVGAKTIKCFKCDSLRFVQEKKIWFFFMEYQRFTHLLEKNKQQ